MTKLNSVLRNGVGITVLGVCLLARTALAGGFKVQDQSTRAMGMIDAFVAGADDASSVYYNPAGLTRLAGPQLITNIYAGHAITRYKDANETDSSDGRIYVLPMFYYGTPAPGSDRLFLGIGVYEPFGLGSKWSDDSPVRYNSTLAEISLVNFNPTVAYRLTDRLSLGAGLDFFTTTVKMRHMNDYSAFGGGDGQVKMEADGRGWGYNLGLQYQCTESIMFGVSYRSQVRVGYDGDAEFQDVPPALAPLFGGANVSYDADAGIDYPASVTVGLSWQATEKLRVELAADWQKWSTRDVQAISVQAPAGVPLPPPTPIDWEDSWVLMLGAEYQLDEKWTLRAGYGFNQTPVPASTADPSLPTGDTHALSFGVGRRVSEHSTLDAACVLAYGERQTLDNAYAPKGSRYYAMSAYFSVGFTYDF
ncbi:MAG: hypothetical protein GXP31_14985 [Kiritimatiellaeota bacterium]|nr:hypothetical protein [Kiritimatiellota bacterium]